MLGKANPGDEFTVVPELQKAIYRDWGLYYQRLHKFDKALNNFDLSLKLDANAWTQLREKCNCLLEQGKHKDALAASYRFTEAHPDVATGYLQRVICLYEQSNFEESLKEAHRVSRQFPNNKLVKAVIDLIEKSTINQSVGPEAGPGLFKLRKTIEKSSLETKRRENKTDMNPRWKQLKNANECDVVSYQEEVVTDCSPLAKKKLKQKQRHVQSTYFGLENMVDIQFLEELRHNKNAMLSMTPTSSNKMRAIIDIGLSIVAECEYNLQSRQPLYAKDHQIEAKQKDLNIMKFYQSQYSNRRKAFLLLSKLKDFAKYNNIKDMLAYIDKDVYEFLSTVTKKNLWRRFEFKNEIYNIVAIEYLKRIRVPSDLMSQPTEQRFHYLFGLLKSSKTVKNVVEEFTTSNNYKTPDDTDQFFLLYSDKYEFYEKRLSYSTDTVEKCYFYHELGMLRLKLRKFDAAKHICGHLTRLAKQMNNFAWNFLGQILRIKIDTTQNNMNKVYEGLLAAKGVAQRLSMHAQHFVNTALLLTENDIRRGDQHE